MAIDQIEQAEQLEQVTQIDMAENVEFPPRTQADLPEVSEVVEAKVAPGILEVEVKRWHGGATSRVFGWQRMAVKDALRLQDETFRCPECLGRVRLRPASKEKRLAEYAEHYSKNTGCSLGNCFSGERQLHIKPLN